MNDYERLKFFFINKSSPNISSFRYLVLFAYRYIVPENIILPYRVFLSFIYSHEKNKKKIDQLDIFCNERYSSYQLLQKDIVPKDEWEYSSIKSWTNCDEFSNNLHYIAKEMLEHKSVTNNVIEYFFVIESLIKENVSINNILEALRNYVFDSKNKFISSEYFFTPKLISRLLSSVIGKKDFNTVLDPSCKSGDLLKLVSTEKDDVDLFGYEENQKAALLSEINLRENGNENVKIYAENALKCSKNRHEKKFDVVVSNPPYGVKLSDDISFQNRHLDLFDKGMPSELAFLLFGLDQLNPKGVGFFILPTGILDSLKYVDLRKGLVTKQGLTTVVLLPLGVFSNSAISTCILFFDRSIVAEEIIFIDGTAVGEKKRGKLEIKQKEIEEISLLLKAESNEQDHLRKVIDKSEVLLGNVSLNPYSYIKMDKLQEYSESLQKNEAIYKEHSDEYLRLLSEMESYAILANDNILKVE